MSKETRKLDNRKLTVIGIVTVLLLLALSAYLIWESPVTLSKRYQDMECTSCHFSGYLQWEFEDEDGTMDKETVDLMISDEELRPLFQRDTFKRDTRKSTEPDPAFCVYLYGHKVYSIVVGQNGEISVADMENMDRTRTFWKDDGSLFESIYETHLSNGGDPLPY